MLLNLTRVALQEIFQIQRMRTHWNRIYSTASCSAASNNLFASYQNPFKSTILTNHSSLSHVAKSYNSVGEKQCRLLSRDQHKNSSRLQRSGRHARRFLHLDGTRISRFRTVDHNVNRTDNEKRARDKARFVTSERSEPFEQTERGDYTPSETSGSRFESMARQVIDNTRQTDMRVASLSVQAVAEICENLVCQGFFEDKVVSLLSRRMWLLENVRGVLDLIEVLLSHGVSHWAVTVVLKNIPIEYHGIAEGTFASATEIAEDELQNKRHQESIQRSRLKSFEDLPEFFRKNLLNLRSLGFSETNISSLLMKQPAVIFTDSKTVSSLFTKLKSLLTQAQSIDVINKCPNVLSDPWEETKGKFDYAFYNMCYYSPDQIAHSRCLAHRLDHIKNRHIFLCRAGAFVSVKEKEDPRLNPNPPLKDVVDSSASRFVKIVEGVGIEDYEVFVRLREVETENAEVNEELVEDDDEDEEDVSEKRRRRKTDKRR